MDIEDLRYFVTGAECGSISAAAEMLYTSQPHVSQVIKRLENELGAVLFERGPEGVKLTSAGEEALYYARNMLRDAQSMMNCGPSRSSRHLRIATNASSSLAYITDGFISSGSEKDLMIDYTECSAEKLIEMVSSRGYDLGFMFVPENKLIPFRRTMETKDIIFEALFTTGLVVNCGRKGPFADRSSVSASELDGCECIQDEEDYFSVEELLLDDEEYRKKGCRISKAVRTNSDHLMMKILTDTSLCNIGISWKVPDSSLGMYAASIKGFEDSVRFGYVSRQSKTLSPEAESYIAYIRNVTASMNVVSE
ncbi:MAG: LysR family transcriptional regulator [Eubacteriaceae bacterium]|nr:LysR family transcriptional regulator [Eubacteriaceae bacterium]